MMGVRDGQAEEASFLLGPDGPRCPAGAGSEQQQQATCPSGRSCFQARETNRRQWQEGGLAAGSSFARCWLSLSPPQVRRLLSHSAFK